MKRAVLFDLDDTLYPEQEFYRSGFAVVAAELARRGVGEADRIGEHLGFLHFHEAREGVFDKAAAHFGYPAEWVGELVSLFHAHTPRVSLYADSPVVLGRLRAGYRLGIVTDGHADVQRRKIGALGVAELVDAVVVTDDLGREHWKPHPLPFLTCCKALGVDAADAVFVGDFPERDIRGARNAGLTGIRIRRSDGYYRRLEVATADRAEFEIESLGELEGVLGRIQSSLRD